MIDPHHARPLNLGGWLGSWRQPQLLSGSLRPFCGQAVTCDPAGYIDGVQSDCFHKPLADELTNVTAEWKFSRGAELMRCWHQGPWPLTQAYSFLFFLPSFFFSFFFFFFFLFFFFLIQLINVRQCLHGTWLI